MHKKIGKYILQEIIKKGGFGKCYKAKDDKNNFYAIKEISIENNQEKINIINEINTLKIMKSKHSVEFIDSIEKDNFYYIIMELCDDDLNNLLKKNRNLDTITKIKIIIQLNKVIKLMHSKKLEHRDLKPENILIKYIN